MIEHLDKPFKDEDSLGTMNPYVREWFTRNFKELTPPQKFSFKLIRDRKSLLIAAPTGSGKTMSAFTSIISHLFDYSLAGKLEDKIYCLYISPLRALNNDIYNNLTKPLEEIYKVIKDEKGVAMIKEGVRKVTIAVRTGDTPQQERRKQLLTPPNILVTTPESLAIMLNSEKLIEKFNSLEYVIVDEIHELANNKRGVHLALSLERLADLIGHNPVRIGLGATLHPLDEAAKFLVGYDKGAPRDCIVVDASWSKELDVTAMSPVKDIISAPEAQLENALYREINSIIKKSKTALIFTNTRSGTERVVFNLKKRFKYGEGDVAAHHGSLSRQSRLDVEDMLKKGALRCVVSSTSLELGVDIGTIDNVIQLGSPKSVTRAVQRIGRAGHSYKAVAKGEMIAMNRDDLVEVSVMLDAARKRHLDAFTVPKNPLDVLSQHIVGMAISRKWNVDEAYNTVRHAYPYADLDKSDFMSLINYLAGNYVGLESRRVYGKIWYDDKTNTIGRRGKLVKVIYMLNLGTIPDEVAVNVFNGTKWVGNIEEEFLARLKQGDVFALGGRLYEFQYAKGTKCYVREATSKSPTIPPWFSEQLPLSYELANEIGEFRAGLAKRILESMKGRRAPLIRKSMKVPKKVDDYLSGLPIDANAKESMYGYFLEQILFAKEVPSNTSILVERTKDIEEGIEYLVFHSLFGRRVNDAMSRVIAILLAEELDIDLSIMVNDNGFAIYSKESMGITKKIVEDVVAELGTTDIRSLLRRNIRNTEMMRRKFRHVAARSFMILKNYKGYKINVGRQQVNSQLLLKAVESIDPNFPILKETYREIFDDMMDLPRLEEVVSGIKAGRIKVKFITTKYPSPFSHNIITFGHADVIMMKGKREYLKKLHSLVLKQIAQSR